MTATLDTVGLLGAGQPLQLLAERLGAAGLPVISAAAQPSEQHPLVIMLYPHPRTLAEIWPHYIRRWPAGTHLVQCGPQPAEHADQFTATAQAHGLLPVVARLVWDTTYQQLYGPLAARRALAEARRAASHPVAQRALDTLAALPAPRYLTNRPLSTRPPRG